jgi:hypothetical protein
MEFFKSNRKFTLTIYRYPEYPRVEDGAGRPTTLTQIKSSNIGSIFELRIILAGRESAPSTAALFAKLLQFRNNIKIERFFFGAQVTPPGEKI